MMVFKKTFLKGLIMKMRVADYIAKFIYEQGVRDVFMVSGGGMMFLSDGICKHKNLNAVCNHHEQASAYAAVSYSKYSDNLGVAFLTTGCGSTNAVTPLLGAWQDSVPCLFISGQSKRKETIRNSNLKLRQKGVQEADIVAIVESITKYSVMINEPNEIKYHLEKAVYLAKHGRPGPVWLDMPLDVQGAVIDEDQLNSFDPKELDEIKIIPTQKEIDEVRTLLEQAKRPIIIAGHGIRLGKSIKELYILAQKTNIPVVSTFLGVDTFPSTDDLYIGRIGNKGTRSGNFAMQNADLILSLGSRLSVSSTGHEYKLFAREAKVIVVDIDPVEHSKNTICIDKFVQSDVKHFIESLGNCKLSFNKSWNETCLKWKKQWPVCLPEYEDSTNGINLHYFMKIFSSLLKDNSVVLADAGSTFYVASQCIEIDKQRRLITPGGQADMGYSLPSSIGACIANDKKEVLAITGDGSFQMNIQELQTLKHYNLPVKLFVWNNDGYLSIRASQSKFFDNRFIGTDKTSGVSFPEASKIANAYGIKYLKVSDSSDLKEVINEAMMYDGPVLCEVFCIRDQPIVPSASSKKLPSGKMVSKPLEDMFPFLDRDEFYENMLVRPVDEDV